MKDSNKKRDYLESNEKRHLNLFEKSHKIVERNIIEKENNFYGIRLRLLINFYEYTLNEIAILCNVDSSDVSQWLTGNDTNNKQKPREQQIKILCILFDVTDSFFTDDSIQIEISEKEIKYFETIKDKTGGITKEMKSLILEHLENGANWYSQQLFKFKANKK